MKLLKYGLTIKEVDFHNFSIQIQRKNSKCYDKKLTGCNQNMISLKGHVFINDEKWACLFPRNAHYIIQHDLKIYVCFPFCNTTGNSSTHIIQNNQKTRLIVGNKGD